MTQRVYDAEGNAFVDYNESNFHGMLYVWNDDEDDFVFSGTLTEKETKKFIEEAYDQ